MIQFHPPSSGRTGGESWLPHGERMQMSVTFYKIVTQFLHSFNRIFSGKKSERAEQQIVGKAKKDFSPTARGYDLSSSLQHG